MGTLLALLATGFLYGAQATFDLFTFALAALFLKSTWSAAQEHLQFASVRLGELSDQQKALVRRLQTENLQIARYVEDVHNQSRELVEADLGAILRLRQTRCAK
jgi:hypothetical protein